MYFKNANIYIKFKIIYNEFGDSMDFNSLSLEEKIGQKFMFGVNSDNIDILIELIKKYHIGGVVLYKKNYNNYQEMLSVIKKLKNANKDNKIPLFISIDQEGGRVNRMPTEIKNVKNIYDMSKKDIELLYENGKVTGEMLSASGINMNFAPVLDLCENNNSKILYNRCFYGNIDDVNSASMKYIKGLHDNGIIPVVKHFPGHGVSKMDSHFIAPYVYNNKKILEKHIKPFENAIKNGVEAVMIGHLAIRGMTDGLPASLSSSFIRKYLRERNNFNGLVITDEINMLSRNIIYRFSYTTKAFLSGSDIILIKFKNKKNVKIIDNFIKYINNNREYVTEIDDSVRRIVDVKNKYNVNDNIEYDGLNIDEINNKINDLNGMCS